MKVFVFWGKELENNEMYREKKSSSERIKNGQRMYFFFNVGHETSCPIVTVIV